MSETKGQWAKKMIALYRRSPHDAAGWTKVSPVVEPMMRTHHGVFEISEPWPDGFARARLTDLGMTLEEWL